VSERGVQVFMFFLYWKEVSVFSVNNRHVCGNQAVIYVFCSHAQERS